MPLSQQLRDFLARNAAVEAFTLRHIVASLGSDSPVPPLVVLSAPALAPLPGTDALVGAPTLAMTCKLMMGRPATRLPEVLLRRSVPRRSLALAIHAVLPVLERAERRMRRRWAWACSPAATRALGALLFLLAIPLALPVLGFRLPHAAAIVTIALGLSEKDGLVVALGAAAGLLSLVLLARRRLDPGDIVKQLACLLKRFVRNMTSAGAAVRASLRRAWRWLAIKLLSGPHAAARRMGPESGARRLPAPTPELPSTADGPRFADRAPAAFPA